MSVVVFFSSTFALSCGAIGDGGYIIYILRGNTGAT
jgi:hypothetical protein